MSNQPKRRRSERIAAYDEQDGDFLFTRGTKRIKTTQPEPIPEDDIAPLPVPTAKKPGRPPKKAKAQEAPAEEAQPVRSRRTSTRRSNQPAAPQDEPAQQLPQRPTRRSRRSSSVQPVEAREVVKEKPTRSKANGAARKQQVTEEQSPQPASISTPEQLQVPKARTKGDKASDSKKIALPFSDTPIINRNKEMRRKTGGRRSSLGMRGRRASSLIESGHSAIPHREVNPGEFYKHIEAEGLPEPRRMKQLLTWCAERALSEKPPLGSSNSNAILGARAIQDQLLKDFGAKSEFSDWFSREDVPRPPAIEKPNPRNVEHEDKIAELEERIKRLKAEKKTWLSLKQAPPEYPPLFSESPSDSTKLGRLPMPDVSLLDSEEAQMVASLSLSGASSSTSNEATNSTDLRIQAQARVRALQQTLEFKIDCLLDGVHKVEQRVQTAGREADRVLALSAARLKEREEKEKKSAGTRDMPVMEVLRSLGRILPEGESGG